MFIRKSTHEAAMAAKDARIAALVNETRLHEAASDALADRIEKYMWQVRDTCRRAEKAEAERDEARAQLAKLQPVRGERGRWRSKKATELPDGLRDNEGKVEFECRSCGSWSEWHGDVADFDINDSNNLCGGSPRCCP